MTTCKECVAMALGACHGDYCYAERIGLIEQVERAAKQGGHTLSDFEQEKKRPMWHAHCVHCGRQITYTLDPEPGTLAIYGDLLDAACTAIPEPDDQKEPATEA